MKKSPEEKLFVQRVNLNCNPFIDHADIMFGAELVFEMGDKKTVFWNER